MTQVIYIQRQEKDTNMGLQDNEALQAQADKKEMWKAMHALWLDLQSGGFTVKESNDLLAAIIVASK